MKTPEELNALKEKVETVSRKLAELTDDELEQVTGGVSPVILCLGCIREPSEPEPLTYDPERPDAGD